MQNARSAALCLTSLFLIASMMPFAAALATLEEPTLKIDDLANDEPQQPLAPQNLIGQKGFDEGTPKTSSSSGRAACPSPSTLQSDGGSSGDAGSDANTSRSLGTNPNSGTTGTQGCVDATDTEDWYEITTTAGKDVDIELVVPTGADFDLYLIDSSGTYVDGSESTTALEKVSTQSTSLSGVASTFFVEVYVYSGDGQYTLRTWTNNTPPKPDLTITSITEPATGQAGSLVSITYVVENIYNATSDAFEVQFVLSSDQSYSPLSDELIATSEGEAALAENTSRTTTTNVQLPSNLANGTYYWLLFADGYDNLTEHNESNNFLASDGVMLVGESCDDLHPNGVDDAGLGADAPNNESVASTSMGQNVTGSYTGCIDGIDGNDVFSFDVPENHTIEAQITLDQSASFTVRLTDAASTSVNYVGSSGLVTTLGTDYDGIGGVYFVNISRSGTGVNWTMDVWTNYSTPKANLAVTSVEPQSLTSSAGATLLADIEVINKGTLLAPASTITAWLSVDGTLSDLDLELGNMSIPSLDINESQILQFSGTVPASAQGGNYTLIVMSDSDELIDEKSEDDNEAAANESILVDQKATACPTQNDGMSGSDAGEDETGAAFLGQDVSMTITGCVHKDVDNADWFEVTVSPGLNLTVTLVNSPDQDSDVYLRDNAGEWFDRGFLAGSNDETVTTESSTTYAGAGGTFYISVEAWLSLGVYTLVIETEGVDPNSFNCGQQNDLGIGQDAPAGNGIDLGTNPSMSGEGCFSGADDLDIYAFSISDSENFDLVFEADTSLPFTVTIQDAGGNLIASADNTSYGMVFQTLDTEFEGQTKDYTVVVDAAGAFGLYNLSINTVGAAPADVAISTLVCPLDHTSGEEVQISWELVSLRGPGNDASIVLHIDLLDDMGAVVSRMVTTTSTVSTQGNLTFGAGSEFFTTPDETPTGNYTCRLTIDVNDDLVESDEDNNVHIGDSFFIQNEEELWANDVDRDGFNTTDSGDGIVDDCPTTFGESTIDRFGCADIDEDGVSNLNDFWPLDASQALDSDLDSFGDNPLGTEGDQCPDVPGVAGGEGGDGCPAAIVDADGDGVLDADDDCPNTPTGTTVGTDGCEVDPTDGTTDNGTDGGNTTTDGNTTTPGDNTGDGNTDGTTDGTEDNTDVTDVQSDSTIFGMSPMIVYALVGLIVVGLVSALLLRGRNSGGQSSVFAEQQKAYDASALPAANDSTITAEQLAYEQQLIAAGYPADAARTYADQHFRPYLNN